MQSLVLSLTRNMNIKPKSLLISLFLGTSVAPALFQPQAVANPPSAYTYAANLAVDSNQCMDEASKAAGLVISELDEPIVHEHGVTQFGRTRATSTTISCIKRSQGSTLTVVSSGDSWDDGTANEAKSIRDRLAQVLSGNL